MDEVNTVALAASLLFMHGQTTERTVTSAQQLGRTLGVPVRVLPHWDELVVELDNTSCSEIVPATPLGVHMGKVLAVQTIMHQVCDGTMSNAAARPALVAAGRLSIHLAERYSGPQSISAALCAPMNAQIRYEQGRFNEAESLILDLMPVVDLAVMLDNVLIAYRVLVRIAIARSDTAQAHALLDRAQALGHKRGWHRLTAAALVERTRLHLREGRIAEAARGNAISSS